MWISASGVYALITAVEASPTLDLPVGRKLTINDAAYGTYTAAVGLLSMLLDRINRDQRREARPVTMPVEEVDAVLVTLTAPWADPVVEQWKTTLTPVEDISAALYLGRVVELTDGEKTSPDDVEAIYRDPHGRYILVRAAENGKDALFDAEWPVGLTVVSTWTDQTVLAADHDHRSTALLALTPVEDGRMQVDPVPLIRRYPRHQALACGYAGGTPATAYRAIVRVVLGALPVDDDVLMQYMLGKATSQLWNAISTAAGPLRLNWPEVQKWARADVEPGSVRRDVGGRRRR